MLSGKREEWDGLFEPLFRLQDEVKSDLVVWTLIKVLE